MKPASPELLAILGSREYFSADLYTIWGGNLGNTVLRYTSGDQDIVANGLTYSCGGNTGPYFDRKDNRAKCRWKVGVEVDTLAVTMFPGTATILGSFTIQTAIRYGLFDGASMMLEKVFMKTYGDTTPGTVRYFLGRVASIDSGRSSVMFNVASHLELLNLQLPRNLFQVSCKNNLGDVPCGVNLESFKTTGVVTNTSTTSAILASLTGTFPAGTFSIGKITFTSGALAGLSWTVRSVTYGSPNTISLMAFMPVAPTIGDSFKIYYGCDKTTGSNGCSKFSNTARYRSELKVPAPTTVT